VSDRLGNGPSSGDVCLIVSHRTVLDLQYSLLLVQSINSTVLDLQYDVVVELSVEWNKSVVRL
jgi:hypothetical protein